MEIQRRLLALLLGLALGLAACGGGGEPPAARAWDDPGFVTGGSWTVYYSALRSSELAPQLAKEYGLSPDSSRGLVVVSLNGEHGTDPRATVSMEVRSLDGSARDVEVMKVVRGDAVSWLGKFTSTHREILFFKISVRPEHSAQAITAEFHRELYLE